MNSREKAAVFMATGFCVGNIPFAPGTFGSLIGLPISFLLAEIQLSAAIIAALFIIGLSVWVSNVAERALKSKDPGCIVVDEMAGMIVSLIGLPFNLTTVLCGFIFFRILDILKPFPIRIIDKRVSGGVGVVADDVVAGIFANLLLRIMFYFFYR